MAPKKKAAKPKPIALAEIAPQTENTPASEMPGITVSAEFRLGKGNVTVALFRNGKKIAAQPITKSGQINFKNGQKDDIISVNGSCSGTAGIVVSPDTNPATPVKFPAGPIHQIFHVL